MKYYKKQKIGENLLYVMVWLAILLSLIRIFGYALDISSRHNQT